MKQLFTLLLVLLAGCKPTSSTAKAAPDYPYTVVTTVGMITDITRNVIGDDKVAKVKGLIGEGVDPHLYMPTRDDIVALSKADVVFYNGLHLEGKMTDVLEKLSAKNPVHAVTANFGEDEQFGFDDSTPDPHVWMNVGLWIQAVETITDRLSAFDPANALRYRQNADAYLFQLRSLDAYARTALASIPESQRVLITAHDAFRYFGAAYGLDVRGIQGISTESEAGVRDIEELVDFIVARKIPAIFVESSVSDKNVRALVEGCAAKGHLVKIGGSLYSDAMGKPGTYGGTYIGMIDHNVTTIAKALGGSATGFSQ